MTLTTEKIPIAGSVHRFSLETYNSMIEAGILTKYDKVELIRGVIVDMAPMGNKHIFSTVGYTNRLIQLYGEEVLVMSQCPVQILPDSEPEPDVAVINSPINRYKERKPQTEDILLIIEVSDSTLAYDRGKKLRLYAEAGIPEVWISNLQDDLLEVYREPKKDKYGLQLTLLPGESVTPLFSETPFDWSQD